MTDDD